MFLAQGLSSVDDGALLDHGSVADLHVCADMRVRSDFHVSAELCSVFDNCGRMNVHTKVKSKCER